MKPTQNGIISLPLLTLSLVNIAIGQVLTGFLPYDFTLAAVNSDGQGLTNPYGFAGKGMKGRGRGHDFLTLVKPQPARRVTGLSRPMGISHFHPKFGLLSSNFIST